MRGTLVFASLARHPVRTTLAVVGVAVAAAMLLDMVMLSSGMQLSFRALLERQGFEIRLAPKGTLPFDTEARIGRASVIEERVRATPGVAALSPVLGTTLHALDAAAATATFALGVRPDVQSDYELTDGTDLGAEGTLVANDAFLARNGVAVGDTVTLAAGYDAQLRTWRTRRVARVTGRARFLYLAADQPAVALPLASLQRMIGPGDGDQVSLFMVRTTAGAEAETVRAAIEQRVPQVTAIATADAVRSVEERLSYFRQLAFILGTVSLVVGFLLITTLVTVSVQERLGEIAVMRAIGVSRLHVVHQVMLEALLIAVAGAAAGVVLGVGTARLLNDILRTFPGLPAAIDFFVFEGKAVWRAVALLVVTAVGAGGFPAWRAASLPIAHTLRTEAVS